MAGTGSGYDLSVDTFSSDGRLFQVEYASKAVEGSSVAMGICCVDGVVLGVERLLHSRMLETYNNSTSNYSGGQIHRVDRQAGMCICGLIPDGKAIVSRAREEAAQQRSVFGVPMLGKTLSTRVGQFMHLFTLYPGTRPFGSSVLLASYSDDGPQLFVSDPSGTTAGYNACALGKSKTIAKTELEKVDFSKITCREAVKKVAEIIYDVHDYVKDKIWDIEIGWVCDESDKLFCHVPAFLIPPKPTKRPGGGEGQ